MDKIVERFGDSCKVVYLPPPTNHENFKNAKESNTSKFHNRILHIGGKAAVKDRNGTNSVIEMIKYSTGDYEVVIKTQTDLNIKYKNERLTIQTNTTMEPEDLYSGYDAMVLPRRYAGLCLPMNEALLSGLPVFMPRISPNNSILPDKWTVEASKIDEFKAKAVIDVYNVDAKTLAKTLDEYMEKKDSLVKQEAFDLGFLNFSTESLRDKYINLINS
jgi:glycosyltransferase involved in cell wall biosynthesis